MIATPPPAARSWPVLRAAAVVRAGGVVAYPTEGVFGLGCLPECERAVARIIALKRRAPTKGLIVIAHRAEALARFVADPGHWLTEARRFGFGEAPVTVIVPAARRVPADLTGGRATIAVRVVQHQVAAALCARVGPLVSTSANLSGRPAAKSARRVRLEFGSRIDFVVPGPTGMLAGPTPIYDVASGTRVR